MKIGSLFSGYGGLEMGVQAEFGGDVAWHAEFDKSPSQILAAHWPDVPNYGDVTAVDWASLEPVDILTGGFPCQDVSLAGLRRGLKSGTRSGLWSEFALAIDVMRPRMVVIENVRGLLSAEATGDMELDPWDLGDGPDRPALRALGAVLGDLAELGYDAEWCGVRAADAGAPHQRFRVFVVAHPERGERIERRGPAEVGGRSDGAEQARVGGEPPTDPDSGRHVERDSNLGSLSIAHAIGDGEPSADAHGDRPGEQQDAAGVGRVDGSDADPSRQWERSRPVTQRGGKTDWGRYEQAVRRWESVTDRTAPYPTAEGRLNTEFVEWMMGLPLGHVTNVGLTWREQLKALGNGVVPQQAALAMRALVPERSSSGRES